MPNLQYTNHKIKQIPIRKLFNSYMHFNIYLKLNSTQHHTESWFGIWILVLLYSFGILRTKHII